MSHRKKMTRKHKKLYQSTSGRYYKVKNKKKSWRNQETIRSNFTTYEQKNQQHNLTVIAGFIIFVAITVIAYVFQRRKQKSTDLQQARALHFRAWNLKYQWKRILQTFQFFTFLSPKNGVSWLRKGTPHPPNKKPNKIALKKNMPNSSSRELIDPCMWVIIWYLTWKSLSIASFFMTFGDAHIVWGGRCWRRRKLGRRRRREGRVAAPSLVGEKDFDLRLQSYRLIHLT